MVSNSYRVCQNSTYLSIYISKYKVSNWNNRSNQKCLTHLASQPASLFRPHTARYLLSRAVGFDSGSGMWHGGLLSNLPDVGGGGGAGLLSQISVTG